MNAFDADILRFVDQFAQRSIIWDTFIVRVEDTNLLKGAVLMAAGLMIGLVGALALTRVMSGMLYGVRSSDPATFGAVSLLLGGAVLFACYIPARRALKVDPTVALRYE